MTRKPKRSLALIPAAALLGLAGIVLLVAVLLPSRYVLSLLTAWGMIPFRFPFLDSETVLSALRCLRAGIDPIAANPCDPLERVFDYSPLWLALAALPVTPAWLWPVGAGIDLAFVAAVVLLPPGRSVRAAALVTVCAVSTAVVFALERANVDLVIFTLCALAAALSLRSPAVRLLGYGCALLAGLLKYYPMLTLALACRERPRRFFGVAGGCLVVLSAFVGVAGGDLGRVLALIPTGSPFGDMFGASGLFLGLAALSGGGGARLGEAALGAVALAVAVRLAWRPTTASDLAGLTERERAFLLAGALLVLACFATAQNIGYRATLVLMSVPSLTALLHLSGRARYRVALGAALLVTWAEGWRHWLDTTLRGEPPWAAVRFAAIEGPRLGAWLLREAAWWVLATLLAALALGLLRQSAIGAWLGLAPLTPPPPAPPVRAPRPPPPPPAGPRP